MKELINCEQLTLDEWLKYIYIPEDERDFSIIDYQFPTKKIYQMYLDNIEDRTDKDIKFLLRLFLLDTVYLESDKELCKTILNYHTKENIKHLSENYIFIEKLFSIKPPWPSIIWILDLLPHNPDKAIQVIQSYYRAHCQYLPDGRSTGLFDAIEIIKLKYIKHYLPVKESLLNLDFREFEFLCAYLYKKKNYEINVTKTSRDGGYDIVAYKNNQRENIKIFIECKRYTNNISVGYIRKLLGKLVSEKATKTVLIATTYFTKPAIDESNKSQRLELINIEEFDYDMRKYVDYNWVYNIPNYINEIKRDFSF